MKVSVIISVQCCKNTLEYVTTFKFQVGVTLESSEASNTIYSTGAPEIIYEKGNVITRVLFGR
jgi:hypothetical protein